MNTRCLHSLLALWLLPCTATTSVAVCGDAPPNVPAIESADVNVLIAALGDDSFLAREAATRRLCLWGPAAAPALQIAAAQPPGEVSLRAQHLLNQFDYLWFWGLEIEVSFSPIRIAWDEAADLLIRIRNPTNYVSRIPLERAAGASGAPISDGEQLASMLDLADWLNVVGPNGNVIPLHRVDLGDEPELQAVLESRLEKTYVTELSPGAEIVFRAPQFNRGGARYRMLDAGTYHVTLQYEPEWNDDELREARVGRIESNRASVEIIRAAPVSVSLDGTTASLEIVPEAGTLVAYLTNHDDQPVVVNTNWGPSTPFAQFTWLGSVGDGPTVEITPDSDPVRPDAFLKEKLHVLGPGERLALGQTSTAPLIQRFVQRLGESDAARWSVQAGYSNLLDRAWQRREKLLESEGDTWPPVLRSVLPRRMLTTRLSSEPVVIRD